MARCLSGVLFDNCFLSIHSFYLFYYLTRLKRENVSSKNHLEIKHKNKQNENPQWLGHSLSARFASIRWPSKLLVARRQLRWLQDANAHVEPARCEKQICFWFPHISIWHHCFSPSAKQKQPPVQANISVVGLERPARRESTRKWYITNTSKTDMNPAKVSNQDTPTAARSI